MRLTWDTGYIAAVSGLPRYGRQMHTCLRFGAVGILNGQFELLNEVCPVYTTLLPNIEQSLHVLFAPLIRLSAEDSSFS